MQNPDPEDILKYFTVPEEQYAFSLVNQGYINDTYLVKDTQYPTYILQRINTAVFKNVEGIMGNIQNVLPFLNAPDYTSISLVPTKANKAYLHDATLGCWRLMSYIEKSRAYNTTNNPVIAFEAGRIIGKFHSLLEAAPKESIVDIIPGFHDISMRRKEFLNALDAAKASLKINAKKAIDFAMTTLPVIALKSQNELPVRICHNDTKLNNILFSKHSDKALCLIDLDTLMKGYFHFDFGDAVRTIVNTAPEDEKDHAKITFDKTLFESFLKGLHSEGSFLTNHEISFLASGAILMPFLHGLRALTDYLNGNIYYKITYDNQNLDRSLSLFDFTKKAMMELDFMEQLIQQLFD